MAGTIEKIKQKVEDVLHKNDGTTTTNTSHRGAGYGNNAGNGVTGNTGYGSSANNDPRSDNYGPHSSNLANKVDPLVDSDRDGNRHGGLSNNGPGATYAQPGFNSQDQHEHHRHNQHNHGTGVGAGVVGSGMGAGDGNNVRSDNYGPHSSNLANKLDPRVDSDRDGSNNFAGNNNSGFASSGAGYNNNNNAAGYSSNNGPHSSNVANKFDPRVDSDGSNNYSGNNSGFASSGAGYNNNNSGLTGHHNQQGFQAGAGNPQSTNAGPHSSNLANKLDPRVDSDADGARNAGMAQYGPGSDRTSNTGPASHTQGPHGSNLVNKLDPMVDSSSNYNTGTSNQRY
jgi:hypothetical protein